MLADHETDTDQCPVPVTLNQPHLLLEIPIARGADETAFKLELFSHVVDFRLDVFVVDGEAADEGESLGGFVPLIGFGEVAGGFVADEHA